MKVLLERPIVNRVFHLFRMMKGIVSCMLNVLGALILGLLVGHTAVLPERVRNWQGRMLSVCLFLLLLAIGMKIGVDRQMLRNLGTLGIQGLFMALAAIGGSMAAFYGVIRFLGWEDENEIINGGDHE